ncbi:MAG: amidohydrolase family protein [Chloroflexi bacterium]|nr:amidohydrolase family protein [Chloroflexota bacterium]
MADRTPTIDSQVHAYERNSPERPWQGFLDGPDEVTGDDMVVAMDAVGVDGALLVSPYSMYRYDPSYALEVYAKHPGKFGLIRPFDAESETIDDDMAEWTGTPGVVGARIMLTYGNYDDGSHPGLNAIVAAAGRAGVPVNIMSTDRMHVVGELARRNPNTQLVIDHVGLAQPRHPPAPPEPWANLQDVVAMAEYDNVAIKISGACTMAQEPFPYPDIWEPLGQLFKAFGFERCLWGTDWTRAIHVLTYEQGVEAFRVTDTLSDSERAMLMGGALTKVYNWSPDVSE